MIDRITPSRPAAVAVSEPFKARGPVPAAVETAGAVPRGASALVSEPRRMAADGPPMDTGRIDRLRASLADGSYVIDAGRIAAAMIAAERSA